MLKLSLFDFSGMRKEHFYTAMHEKQALSNDNHLLTVVVGKNKAQFPKVDIAKGDFGVNSNSLSSDNNNILVSTSINNIGRVW